MGVQQALLMRRPVRLVMVLMLLAGFMIAGSAGAVAQEADDSADVLPGTPVSVTFTTVEVLDPGEEWVGADGGFHFSNSVEINEVSGDVEGTATVIISGDFIVSGECSEESCEGSFSISVQIDIETEDGGWTGHGGLIATDEDSYSAARIVLVGNGANAGQVIVLNEVVEETEESITFTGTQVGGGLPSDGINLSYDLCFTGFDEAGGGTAAGGFIMNGPFEASGSAQASFSVVGGPTPRGIFGEIMFAAHDGAGNELGVMHGMFVEHYVGGGAAHNIGTFVVTGGTGVFEGMIGHGKMLETVTLESTDSSCAGPQGQWLGASHTS